MKLFSTPISLLAVMISSSMLLSACDTYGDTRASGQTQTTEPTTKPTVESSKPTDNSKPTTKPTDNTKPTDTGSNCKLENKTIYGKLGQTCNIVEKGFTNAQLTCSENGSASMGSGLVSVGGVININGYTLTCKGKQTPINTGSDSSGEQEKKEDTKKDEPVKDNQTDNGKFHLQDLRYSKDSNGKGFLYKSEAVFINGVLSETQKPILGTIDYDQINRHDNDVQIYLADNFYAKSTSKEYEKTAKELAKNKVSFDIVGNDNKKITEIITWAEEDISGVTAESKTAETFLNEYSQFKEAFKGVKFPQGSTCLRFDEFKISTPYYIFIEKDSAVFKTKTIEEWKKEHSDKDVKTTAVGIDNTIKLAYFDETGGDHSYRNAVIERENDLMRVHYENSEKHKGGIFECGSYNDVAIKFLEKTVKDKIKLSEFDAVK